MVDIRFFWSISLFRPQKKENQQTFVFHCSKYIWYIFNLSNNSPCRFITYKISFKQVRLQLDVSIDVYALRDKRS